MSNLTPNFVSPNAKEIYDAMDEAWCHCQGDMGEWRQKRYYSTIGIAFSSMEYSREMMQGVFKEYRKSLDPFFIDTHLVKNALDALQAHCKFWWQGDTQSIVSCYDIALDFLADPECFLDAKKARHEQIKQIEKYWSDNMNGVGEEEYTKGLAKVIASTNAEIKKAKVKPMRTGSESHAAIRTAADGRVDAPKPTPHDDARAHAHIF